MLSQSNRQGGFWWHYDYLTSECLKQSFWREPSRAYLGCLNVILSRVWTPFCPCTISCIAADFCCNVIPCLRAIKRLRYKRKWDTCVLISKIFLDYLICDNVTWHDIFFHIIVCFIIKMSLGVLWRDAKLWRCEACCSFYVAIVISTVAIMASHGLNIYCDVTPCMNLLWIFIGKIKLPKGIWPMIPTTSNETCVIILF